MKEKRQNVHSEALCKKKSFFYKMNTCSTKSTSLSRKLKTSAFTGGSKQRAKYEGFFYIINQARSFHLKLMKTTDWKLYHVVLLVQ